MIKSIYIESFGKIKNKEIFFDDELNIIYGDNEAGKTTVCAFIKAMLYGMDNSRKNDIRTVARKRYMPLDGSSMSGSMQILNYKITRSFGKTAKEDTVSVIDVNTGEKISGDIGKILFGLNEDAFSDILFSESYSGKISSGDEIISKLVNLQSSMDEDTSYHQAIEQLDTEKRKITGRNGIKALEIEIAELKSRISDLTDEYTEYVRNKEMLEEKKSEYKKLKERKEYLDELCEKIHMANMYKQCSDLEAECEILSCEIESLNKNDAENGMPLPYEVYELEADYKKSKKINAYYIISVILFILSLTGFLGMKYAHLYGLFALLPVSVVMLLVGMRKRSRRINDVKEKLNSVLDIYNSKNAEEYEREYNSEQEKRKDRISRLCEILKSKSDMIGSLRNELYGIDVDEDITEFYSEADVNTELCSTTNRLYELEKKIFVLERNTEFETESPEDAYRLLETKRNDIAKMHKNLKCIELVRENINSAFSQLQNGFGPKLNKKASEIFKAVTGDKYENVIVDANLDISLSGKNSIIDSVYLSNGTLDAVYFSLKSAISEIIFENKESLLLLDDAFIQYDDARADKAMEYLKSTGRQVLYFTCQKRFNKNIDLIKDL